MQPNTTTSLSRIVVHKQVDIQLKNNYTFTSELTARRTQQPTIVALSIKHNSQTDSPLDLWYSAVVLKGNTGPYRPLLEELKVRSKTLHHIRDNTVMTFDPNL